MSMRQTSEQTAARILEVGEAEFEHEVLDRSEHVPVIVDFWAPWCSPCRVVGPLLERLAEEYAGAFVLAKVDVDQAPNLAGQLGIRAVPTLLGIRDRTVRAELTGAQPEPELRRLVESVLPTEADRRAEEGDRRAAGGDLAEAEAAYRTALEQEPRHGRALVGLARLRAEADALDEALDLLDRVLPHEPVHAEAERLAAELRVQRQGGAEDPEALRARLAEHPEDLAVRIELGRALAAHDRHEEALDELLEAVRRDPGFEEEAARRAMLDCFEVLGNEHPLTQRYRSELARALFR